MDVDVTNIIWKAASIHGFSFRAFAPETIGAAMRTVLGYLSEGALAPKVSKTFALEQAPEALRYLIEGRPYGRVVLTI